MYRLFWRGGDECRASVFAKEATKREQCGGLLGLGSGLLCLSILFS